MPKDTKSLGNNKAPACESRGFVRKKEGVLFDTPSFFYRFIPFVRSEICIPDRISLYQEAQQDTGSYSRTDHTGYVRAHGVHQQVIARIVFQTNDLGNTG